MQHTLYWMKWAVLVENRSLFFFTASSTLLPCFWKFLFPDVVSFVLYIYISIYVYSYYFHSSLLKTNIELVYKTTHDSQGCCILLINFIHFPWAETVSSLKSLQAHFPTWYLQFVGVSLDLLQSLTRRPWLSFPSVYFLCEVTLSNSFLKSLSLYLHCKHTHRVRDLLQYILLSFNKTLDFGNTAQDTVNHHLWRHKAVFLLLSTLIKLHADSFQNLNNSTSR